MLTHAARRGARTARAISSARSGGALQSTRRSAGSDSTLMRSPGMGFLRGAYELERATPDVLFDVGGGDVAILGEVELARLAVAEGDLDDRGVAQKLEGEAELVERDLDAVGGLDDRRRLP